MYYKRNTNIQVLHVFIYKLQDIIRSQILCGQHLVFTDEQPESKEVSCIVCDYREGKKNKKKFKIPKNQFSIKLRKI